MALRLENYRAGKLDYENRIEGNVQLQVRQRFNTRVNYLPDCRCACIYSVTITDADESLPFHISAELIGFFSYDEGMEQVDIHVEATRLLFPYLKSTVAMLTALSGAPVFHIQNHEVKPEDIVGKTKESVPGAN